MSVGPPERRKSESPRGGGLSGNTTGQQQEEHPNRSHPEFQGRGNSRHRDQHAPTWPRPRGTDAADALETAFVGVATKYVVVATKATGKRAALLTTPDRAEAERWLAMHRQFAADCGATLEIEVAK